MEQMVSLGRQTSAVELLGYRSQYDDMQHLDDQPGPQLALRRDQAIADCRAGLGEEAFQAAGAAGQALPLEQAVDQALNH